VQTARNYLLRGPRYCQFVPKYVAMAGCLLELHLAKSYINNASSIGNLNQIAKFRLNLSTQMTVTVAFDHLLWRAALLPVDGAVHVNLPQQFF